MLRWVSSTIVLAACGAAQPRRPEARDPLARGAPAPDVVVTDLDGRSLHLRELRGQVVLLDFWTTTCAPCTRALPTLVELNATFHDRGFQLISITPERASADLRERVTGDRMTWIVATDASGPIHAAFRIDRYPMYFLIDDTGAIACSRCSLDEVRRELRRLRR